MTDKENRKKEEGCPRIRVLLLFLWYLKKRKIKKTGCYWLASKESIFAGSLSPCQVLVSLVNGIILRHSELFFKRGFRRWAMYRRPQNHDSWNWLIYSIASGREEGTCDRKNSNLSWVCLLVTPVRMDLVFRYFFAFSRRCQSQG